MCQIGFTHAGGGPAIATVSISLFRFASLGARLRAFAQMGLARPALWRDERLVFWKLCGSGIGAGFHPVPNPSVCGLIAVWRDGVRAADAAADHPGHRRFRRIASESLDLFLEPVSSRGSWSRRAPFVPGESPPGPLAVLTRGSIKPWAVPQFWRRSPRLDREIDAGTGVLFRIGLGEIPWLHQITVSVWPDAAAMSRFAHAGPHAAAIRAARGGRWFSEDLYARFVLTGLAGSWGGAEARLAPHLHAPLPERASA